MLSNANLLYSLMLVVGDFLAIILAFGLAYILRVKLGFSAGDGTVAQDVKAIDYILALTLITPLWLMIFASMKLYNREIFFNRIGETSRLLVGSFVGIMLVISYDFLTNKPLLPAKLVAVYGVILAFCLLFLERTLLRKLRLLMFKKGKGLARVLLVGSTKQTKALAQHFQQPGVGFKVAAIVGSKDVLPKDYSGKHYSTIDQALNSFKKLNLTTVVQTELYKDGAKNKALLQKAQDNHLGYKYIPTGSGLHTGTHSVDLFQGYPVISIHQTALVGWGRVAKRVFDVVAASIALVALLPVMLVTAAIRLFEDGGPILFKQKRLTRHNKHIYVYKFRTMSRKFSGKDQEKAFRSVGRDDLADQFLKVGHQVDFKNEKDIRLTPFGRFIRSASIDEMPQLWNVIKGDISLVGPRAIVPEELKFFKELGNQMLHVKTGITGLAQVSGRSEISHDERARLNAHYVRNWTFWLDIKILIKTVKLLFTRQGIR